MGIILEHTIIHTRNRYSYKSKHKYLKINIEKGGVGSIGTKLRRLN